MNIQGKRMDYFIAQLRSQATYEISQTIYFLQNARTQPDFSYVAHETRPTTLTTFNHILNRPKTFWVCLVHIWVIRGDVASHSFEPSRRRLDDHKTRQVKMMPYHSKK